MPFSKDRALLLEFAIRRQFHDLIYCQQRRGFLQEYHHFRMNKQQEKLNRSQQPYLEWEPTIRTFLKQRHKTATNEKSLLPAIAIGIQALFPRVHLSPRLVQSKCRLEIQFPSKKVS